MLPALLLLACADASFCPTPAELQRAVRRHEDDIEASLNQDPELTAPEGFTWITLHRFKRITDIYCGEPLDGPPRTLNCKFTLHYPRRRAFHVAQLAIEKGEWVIRDTLSVSRNR